MSKALPDQSLLGSFDEALYLTLNPDLQARLESGEISSAEAHWNARGREEERAGARPTINQAAFYIAPPPARTTPPSQAERASFSPQHYLQCNPDVSANGYTVENAIDHWIEFGRFEGRTPSVPGQRCAARGVDLARLSRKPFGVDFYAPFSARSGLGSAARGYLAALREAAVPVQLFNINYDMRPARVTVRAYDTPPRYRIAIIQANADSIGRVYDLFRLGQFDDAYVIGIWAWELNVLRPDWYPSFAAVDEIWALSDFNAAAVRATAPVPVRTMHCPVLKPAADPALDRDYFGLPDGFLFMAAFDVGSSLDRKNPAAVVKAFATAFGGRPDVFLLLKLHSGEDDLTHLLQLLGAARDLPNVIIRSGKMTIAEMNALQSCVDCLVSAHRAEGFGLNIAECMLQGKPAIVTGYSGNMDFTDARNSYLVKHRLKPIERQSGPYLPGYLWAEPDLDDLARCMRQVVEQPGDAALRGAAGMATVRERLSPRAVGQTIRARLAELGLDREVPAFVALAGASRSLPTPAISAAAPQISVDETCREPTISVIVPVYNVAPEWLAACIESVRAQTYPRWQLCLCDDASSDPATVAMLRSYQGQDPRICIQHLPVNSGIAAASNAAARMATGRYLLMLDDDDVLTADALHHIALAVSADPAIDALYADEDKLDEQGCRCDHYFKPDWSPEHLESVMYTLHPLTVKTSLFLEMGGFREAFAGAQDYDLMLRASRRTSRIHHVPRVLYHWRKSDGSAAQQVDAKPDALRAARRAIEDHTAAKYGNGAAYVVDGRLAGTHRVRRRLSGPPQVTLAILTHRESIALPGRPRFTMVDNLISSIRKHTKYAAYRILVVDDRNSTARQAAAYRAEGIELQSYPGTVEPFNFADKANFAWRQVRTEHLVMLNDDMEVFDEEWLTALIELSQDPGIGACGGKLLHADGTIQHAGVVLGINGGAAHPYHGFPGAMVGYNGFTHVIRNYSAVTGACFATRRSVLQEVGGFDTAFAIDYNDIDLCLRLRRHGYRIAYTPFCQMYHFESASARRTTQNPVETALFRRRWGSVVERDPFYNPNLSRSRLDFSAR